MNATQTKVTWEAMSIDTTLRALMQRKLVRGKPISPNRLAHECSIPQSTMWRIINGEVTDVRTRNLEKLARFFGVTVPQLLGHQPMPDLPKADVPSEQVSDAPPVVAGAGAGDMTLEYVTPQEQRLLQAFRLSSPTGQQTIAGVVPAIAAQNPARKKT